MSRRFLLTILTLLSILAWSVGGWAEEPVKPVDTAAGGGEEKVCLGIFLNSLPRTLDYHITTEALGGITAEEKIQYPFFEDNLTPTRDIKTVDALFEKLRAELKGVSVTRNARHPNVLHLVEEQLLKIPGYAMPQKTSVRYKGQVDELPEAIGKQVPGIHAPRSAMIHSIMGDFNTIIDIDVRDQPVRDILTDCLPLKLYKRLLWESETIRQPDGTYRISVRFQGVKSLGEGQITAKGSNVVVSPGMYGVSVRTATVSPSATLPIAAGPIRSVQNEPLKLSVDKPAGYAKGTRLQALLVQDVTARGAFVPGSLEIRLKPDGELLKEGDDYLVDADWGLVGLGPKSRVTAEDTVYASYRYALLRMDTIQVSNDGIATLKTGEPHISAPVPPAADRGNLAIAHVFVDYRDTEVTPERIFPITEWATDAGTATNRGRIPKTLAKLKAGEPVTIVCWGDSVTAGGNASKPERAYVEVFAAGLRERFPKSKIDVQNISAGGSNTRQWLEPEKYAYRGLKGAESPTRFERVLAAKPDLVTIEFVNDMGRTPTEVEQLYGEILKRLEPLGAEVILITPHFVMPRLMKFQDAEQTDRRPYVIALREFAGQHKLALADAAARWQHLAKEGIPYMTLLHNTINHPDDRGHRMFAEELWKCFEEKP